MTDIYYFFSGYLELHLHLLIYRQLSTSPKWKTQLNDCILNYMRTRELYKKKFAFSCLHCHNLMISNSGWNLEFCIFTNGNQESSHNRTSFLTKSLLPKCYRNFPTNYVFSKPLAVYFASNIGVF